MANIDTALTRSELLFGVLEELLRKRADRGGFRKESPFAVVSEFQVPRKQDPDAFKLGLEGANKAASGIGPAAIKINEVIKGVDEQIERITSLMRSGGFAKVRDSDQHFGF